MKGPPVMLAKNGWLPALPLPALPAQLLPKITSSLPAARGGRGHPGKVMQLHASQGLRHGPWASLPSWAMWVARPSPQ